MSRPDTDALNCVANPNVDVTIAKDGQEALDLVRHSMQGGDKFNLVFMDIQMPNLDGIQSTKRIRELGFSAPIVALTAFAEDSNVKECMDSGMDFFLPKPIRRPALKGVLKKYCNTIPEEEYEGQSMAHVPTLHLTTTDNVAVTTNGSPVKNSRTQSVDIGDAPDEKAEKVTETISEKERSGSEEGLGLMTGKPHAR